MEKENGSDLGMKLMVVIDESDCSYHALMWVLENLKESIKNSPVTIFIAQPFPKCCSAVSAALGFARIYTPFSATIDLINTIQEQNKKVSLGLLEKAKRICTSKGVVAETLTEIGDPKEVICEVAEKLRIQVLVLGSHNQEPIQRCYMGSICSYCVKNAKCQVLVVKN